MANPNTKSRRPKPAVKSTKLEKKKQARPARWPVSPAPSAWAVRLDVDVEGDPVSLVDEGEGLKALTGAAGLSAAFSAELVQRSATRLGVERFALQGYGPDGVLRFDDALKLATFLGGEAALRVVEGLRRAQTRALSEAARWLEGVGVAALHGGSSRHRAPAKIPSVASLRRVTAADELDKAVAHWRAHLERVFADHGQNAVVVAESLGIPRRTLYRRMEEYGLNLRRGRSAG
ncbi:MAG: hypothetical protein JNK72_23565 [Myxococcales bacterium]|nr:hypothetical protein [Myxococcales bacterium]